MRIFSHFSILKEVVMRVLVMQKRRFMIVFISFFGKSRILIFNSQTVKLSKGFLKIRITFSERQCILKRRRLGGLGHAHPGKL